MHLDCSPQLIRVVAQHAGARCEPGQCHQVCNCKSWTSDTQNDWKSALPALAEAVMPDAPQMMQFMEADVTEPAGMFGLNAVMLPEHMRNAGMAEVCPVASPDASRLRDLARPPTRLDGRVQARTPALGLRHKRRFDCMQGGKERLQKYLPLVEGRMGDGRKYIAGDEFTAAGVNGRLSLYDDRTLTTSRVTHHHLAMLRVNIGDGSFA